MPRPKKPKSHMQYLQDACALFHQSQAHHRTLLDHPQFGKMHYRMCLLSQKYARQAYEDLQEYKRWNQIKT